MFLKVSKLASGKVSKDNLLNGGGSKWDGKLMNNKNDRIHIYLKQNGHKKEYYIIDSGTDENIFNKLNLFLTERYKTIKRKGEINTSTNSLFILTDEIKLLVKLDNVVGELNFKDLNEQLYRSFDRN